MHMYMRIGHLHDLCVGTRLSASGWIRMFDGWIFDRFKNVFVSPIKLHGCTGYHTVHCYVN